ncbi:hypothetical protein [Actinomadura flavalba]|uniref:hypothetical protein n=1 Tax=Actinomadura flavalba TaxID=1120938 RepID=UPI000381DF5A|nr:hypothetical protein [Actinomadura flavalba]
MGAARPPADLDGPLHDPARRAALVDAFVAEFAGSATWKATLAVLEGAFPGRGMASSLARRTDELWRIMDPLDRVGGAALGLPAWTDGAGGIVLDVSAHRATGDALSGEREPVRSRASRPYAGAFVIDTLDPLRYHRAMGGPQAPGDGAPATARIPGEDDDTGVVIVADLRTAGSRILDATALWRFVGRIITATLLDPARPETRLRTRRALRALRRTVLVDPALGLALCLHLDPTRTPHCLLAIAIDRTETNTPHFVRL